MVSQVAVMNFLLLDVASIPCFLKPCVQSFPGFVFWSFGTGLNKSTRSVAEVNDGGRPPTPRSCKEAASTLYDLIASSVVARPLKTAQLGNVLNQRLEMKKHGQPLEIYQLRTCT